MTTNTYLNKISVTSNMVKQAKEKNNEIRDTAVIGAVGTGSSLATNAIQDKLGLNGAKKVGTALKAKSSGGAFKALGTALRSPGLKRGLKIGAIGGAIGLAGDYAAVKINKKLEKSAMNVYLEKVAEMYSINGHPGLGRGILDTPKIQLEREEYHDYARRVDSHGSQKLPLALGALGAGVAGGIAFARGGRPGAAAILGAIPGLFAGRAMADKISHNAALREMKMMHPTLLETE